jgi:uncharacterized protein (DUF488 family)
MATKGQLDTSWEALTLQKRIRIRRRAMKIVYTIGYEGTDIERFVATLKAVGIQAIADVRALALSRKTGFSKNALRTRLEREGIAYVHFVELGDPKPGREAARAGKYDQFRRIYKQHLSTPEARGALNTLADFVATQETCLLCFERDPTVCHRSIVADQMKSSGFEVFDLYGDIPSRYADFSAQRSRRHSRKSATTAEQAVR